MNIKQIISAQAIETKEALEHILAELVPLEKDDPAVEYITMWLEDYAKKNEEKIIGG